MSQIWTASVITLVVAVVAAVLVNAVRRTGGVALSIAALLASTPVLLGLPLFEGDSSIGTSIQWLARFLIGLGILGLLYVIAFVHECISLLFLPARDSSVPELAPGGTLTLANGLMLASSGGADRRIFELAAGMEASIRV